MEEASRHRDAARDALASSVSAGAAPLPRAQRDALRDARFTAGIDYVLAALRCGARRPDLCSEIHAVFSDCVNRPIRTARSHLSQALQSGATGEVRRWRKTVTKKVQDRVDSFVDVADAAMRRAVGTGAGTTQTATAMRRAVWSGAGTTQTATGTAMVTDDWWVQLMSVSLRHASDCWKYLEDFQRAHAALQVLLCFCPADGETHRKLAVLAWQETDEGVSALDLRAAYHFCVQLANEETVLRLGDVGSNFAHFVAHVKKELDGPPARKERRGSSSSARYRFSSRFILLAWELLTERDEGQVECEFDLHEVELWKGFTACLAREKKKKKSDDDGECMDEADLRHVAGIAIYVRHRWSPIGDPQSTQHPGRARLADRLVRGLALCLINQVEAELKDLNKKCLARKKNRQRSAQKARKRNATPADAATAASPQVPAGLRFYADVYEEVDHSRTLAILSFLTHFWVKTLVVTDPLAPYKEILDAANRVAKACNSLTGAGGITAIRAHVATAAMNAGASQDHRANQEFLPALTEDVAFSSFLPCVKRNLFRRIKLVSPSLAKALGGENGNLSIKTALAYFEVTPFIAHMHLVSSKHLDAFSQRVADAGIKDGARVINQPQQSDVKAAVRSLVELSLQMERFGRLSFTLTQFASGRIVRLHGAGQSARNNAVSTSPLALAQAPSGLLEQRALIENGETSPPKLPGLKRRRLAAAMTQPPPTPAAAHVDSSSDMAVVTPEFAKPAPKQPAGKHPARESPGRGRGKRRRQENDALRPRMGNLEPDRLVNTQGRAAPSEPSMLLGQKACPRSQLSVDSPVIPQTDSSEKRKAPKRSGTSEAVDFLFYGQSSETSSPTTAGGYGLPLLCRHLDRQAAKENPFVMNKSIHRRRRGHRGLSQNGSQLDSPVV